jgi:hypothetical protein
MTAESAGADLTKISCDGTSGQVGISKRSAPNAIDAPIKNHGTHWAYYNRGCNCDICREAHNQRMKEYRERRMARTGEVRMSWGFVKLIESDVA